MRLVTTLCLTGLVGCGLEDGATSLRDTVDPRVAIVGGELAVGVEGAPFEATARGFHARGNDITVAHDGAAITVTTGDRSLVIGASELVVDGEVIDVAERPLIDDDGALIAPRGSAVERVAMTGSGLELAWQLRDVRTFELRIPTTGYQFVGQTATGLVFRSGRDQLVVSDAVWLDASGEARVIATGYRDGAIVISGTAAAAAPTGSLSITIGTERAVDSAIAGSPTGADSRSPSVAFSGAQYLAVWQDLRSGIASIYATRLSTTGAVLDTAGIAIASTATASGKPVVVFVGGRYLVVWEDRGTGGLAAAVVTPATGAVAKLGTIAPLGKNPTVAVRGSEALVAFERGGDVYAARFANSAFGAPFAVAQTANTEAGPSVTADPSGSYLVAFSELAPAPATQATIRTQLVTAAGALTGNPLAIAPAQVTSRPSAAFGGGNFIVSWTAMQATLSVAATRITPAGAMLDTHLQAGAPVGGIMLATDRRALPSIGCSGARCFVSYRRHDATAGDEVYGQLIDAGTLAPIGAEVVVAGGVENQTYPVTVAAGTGFFTAWVDDRDGIGFSAIGARIDANGAVLDASGILLARGFNRQTSVAAARSGNNWFAAWTDSRVRGNNLLGSHINNAGNASDTPALNVSNASSAQTLPAVAVSATTGDYLVAWTDKRNSRTSDIFFSRVLQNGGVRDTTGIALSTAAKVQVRPDIAADTTGNFLIVWQDHRNGDADVFGAIVDSNGAVTATDIPIAVAVNNQTSPQAVFDPVAGVYLVVWGDRRQSSTARDIFAARVTPAGTVLDTAGVAILANTTQKVQPALAFGSDRALVVWREADDIRGARVQLTSGITVLDRSGFTITSAAGIQSAPTVTYLGDSGRNFAIAWSDERNLVSQASDIYGTLVVENTAAVASEFQIATSNQSETRPVFSRGRSKKQGNTVETLIGYQRITSAEKTDRVMMRKLTFQP